MCSSVNFDSCIHHVISGFWMRKIIVLQNEAELGVTVLGRLWRLKCSRHTSHELQLNLRQPPWPSLRPSARPRILCCSPLMQLFVLCFNVNRVSVHTISPRSNLYSPLLHPRATYLKWPCRAWPCWLPVLSHVCRFERAWQVFNESQDGKEPQHQQPFLSLWWV